jgi:hypothetical protein
MDSRNKVSGFAVDAGDICAIIVLCIHGKTQRGRKIRLKNQKSS